MTSTALRELLEQASALRLLARELVGDAADDVLQEAAIQTITAPPRPGPMGGWLAAVVRNLASKHRRAERTRQRHEAAAAERRDGAASDRSIEDADMLRALTEMVTALPEPYRQTVFARFFRDQTPTAIAKATHTPVATVKTRLQRGLAMLRERLEERGADWRSQLVLAFALRPSAPVPATISSSMIMKIALPIVVLLPIGFGLWWSEARSPTATGSARAGAAAPAGSAQLVAPNPIGEAPEAELPDRPSPGTAVGAGAGPKAVSAAVPFLRVAAAGPKAFRAAFGNTNLGRVLASEPGGKLWRPLLAPLEQMWRQFDGGKDFAATRERMLEFDGMIRMLWMVEPGRPDRAYGVLAVAPDGRTDMGALGDDLSRLLAAAIPGDALQQRVGDRSLTLRRFPNGATMTVPLLIGSSLVSFFAPADALGEVVPRGLATLAADRPEKDAPPLSVRIDLAQLRKFAFARAEPEAARFLGLLSLRQLHATVRPNGVRAQLDIAVDFESGPRGILAGLLPDVSTLPKLLSRRPAKATPWFAAPFRPDVIFREVLRMTAAEREETIAAQRQKFIDDLGIDFDRELLDHLGGEVMVLGDLWNAGDRKTFTAGDDPPIGACVVWDVTDVVAFQRGFDKLMRHTKGIVNRYETRDVAGVKITRVGSAFVTGTHLAVGKGLFAIAIGKEGVAQLEKLVTARPVQQVAGAALSAPVERVRQLAPAGFHGVGVTDLRALFGGQVALTLAVIEDGLPAPMRTDLSVDATQEWLEKMLPLVEAYDLEHIVTMTGYAENRWRLRTIW